jgi:hypothetical protein
MYDNESHDFWVGAQHAAPQLAEDKNVNSSRNKIFT